MFDAGLGSHASAAGREQNGSFGVCNGDKQTRAWGLSTAAVDPSQILNVVGTGTHQPARLDCRCII